MSKRQKLVGHMGYNCSVDPISTGAQQFFVLKFGRQNSTSNSAQRGIWELPKSFDDAFKTSASSISIAAGGNANDAAAGTHAQSVTIEGLDANWNLARETIATNGISASTGTTTTFIRVFRAYVGAVGTYGNTNAGDITLSDGTNDIAIIKAGEGQTEMAIYTVPANHTAFLMMWSVNSGTDTVSFSFYRRDDADVTASGSAQPVRLVSQLDDVKDGSVELDHITHPIRFAEKTDLFVTCQAASGGGAQSCDSEFDLFVIHNDLLPPDSAL